MARAKKKHWVDDGKGHRGKCDAKRDCVGMRLALQRDTRGPGLDRGCAINFATGKNRAVTIYRKAAADSGIAVNFCPWCGERVDQEPAANGAA